MNTCSWDINFTVPTRVSSKSNLVFDLDCNGKRSGSGVGRAQGPRPRSRPKAGPEHSEGTEKQPRPASLASHPGMPSQRSWLWHSQPARRVRLPGMAILGGFGAWPDWLACSAVSASAQLPSLCRVSPTALLPSAGLPPWLARRNQLERLFALA